MTKRKLEKILVVLLTLFILISQVKISNATNISDIQQQMQENESGKTEVESQIEDMEGQQSDLQTYLSELKTQLNELNTNLAELKQQITQKEQEIEENNKQLEEAKNLEIKQYEAMKMRIKFMYESQDDSYMDILLSSGSVSDMINRTEYANQLLEYDRDMLEKYQETKITISETENSLKQEQADLLLLQADVEKKQNEISTVVAQTKTEISKYQSQIEAAMEEALAYDQKIRKQQDTIEKLQEEEARRQAEAQNPTVIVNDYVQQAGDIELLAAIIYCEARGESYEGMLAVGSVVLNRVNCDKFPDTIREVIYQSGQFAPVTSSSNSFELALAMGANSTCIQAAQEVLNGHITGNWLYFRTVNNIIQGTIIGNHVFY